VTSRTRPVVSEPLFAAVQGDTELASAIARRIGEPRYKLWFEGHTRFRREEEQFVVGVPNRHFEEWLERTFRDAVAEAVAEVYGEPLPVRFTIDPELFQASRREQENVARAASPGPGRPVSPIGPIGPISPIGRPPIPLSSTSTQGADAPRSPVPKKTRIWRKLGDFVVGPCNRVAHASALSVIESPGETANPLVLHGPVGTGKTHLLEGIYAGLRRTHSDWKVTYITSEDFTNRFVQAMRLDKLGAFRKQFRECDVLLVDDLHFLATKKATQEEFLHTFDALLADGRQLVLTCDCHPRLADDFSPELLDRLLGGAVWGLSPPDSDTRLEILRAKSRVSPGTIVPDEVLRFLAGQLRGNVRELEGAIQSIRHYSRVTARTIDVPLVREALADLLRHAVRVVHLEDVDRAVCAVLRLDPGTLQGKGRSWVVSRPRMVAMMLSRKHTAAAYSAIGEYFGGRNHSTVVAAEKKVRKWLQDNAELALGERRIRVRELVERVERDLLR
jgi:chromosomal replication initiator protein